MKMRTMSFLVVGISLLFMQAVFAGENPQGPAVQNANAMSQNPMIEIGDYTPNGFVTSLRDVETGQPITAQPVVIVRGENQQIIQVTPITSDHVAPSETNPEPGREFPRIGMLSVGLQYELGINNFSATMGVVIDVSGESGF